MPMKEQLFLKTEHEEELELNIEDYEFSGLKQALEKSREEIVAEIKESGLKGRGGAGFPTGIKWEFALQETGKPKYMICNADEGEPGTFKDRYLLEYQPYKVLEGIVIAAYATGATDGYIYIRGEYAEPIDIFAEAIKKARENNILGANLLDTDFSFDLELVKGAGAYVCGDETSLINSIEGERGRSRIKPPYPIQEGLFGQPTTVNNVETLATAAEIIKQGTEQYTSLGTENSRGTKLVSISGDVNEPGVYEVEFGKATVAEIIDEFGQGIRDNRDLKFVIPGGISTAILPREKIDASYTYEDLEEAGSGLGSGAIIVVAEGHELIDMLLNVAEFFMDETCGTCFPCREGNRQIYHIIKEAKEKDGFTKRDLEIIKDIGNTIRLAARCGLGQASMNFIRSVVDNYTDELVAGREQ